MITLSSKIINVMENPFYISGLIKFIVMLKNKERDINFWEIYLLIPLAMNPEVIEIFRKTNSAGRLEKLFQGNEYLLENLNQEIMYYKEIINKAIIILINKKEISVDFDTGNLINKNLKKSEVLKLDKNTEKGFKNIVVIFSKKETKYIFQTLGVDKL